jgi:hypothetical protein
MNQNIQLVTLCAGTIIPAIIGLITSTRASVPFQTALSAALSVAVGLISTWTYRGGAFDWETAAIATLTTLISTLVLAHSFYHQTGATTKIQKISDGVALDRLIGDKVQSTP